MNQNPSPQSAVLHFGYRTAISVFVFWLAGCGGYRSTHSPYQPRTVIKADTVAAMKDGKTVKVNRRASAPTTRSAAEDVEWRPEFEFTPVQNTDGFVAIVFIV